MGAPLWTQEEKDCFVNFIIPQSQFSSGQYDPTTGLTWKELAPLMEAEMTRRGGYPALRVYTENALSQFHYNRFSARALSRGQSDMTHMRASPRMSQPLLGSSITSAQRSVRPPSAEQRPPTAAITSSRKTTSPPGSRWSRYATRFTQTDPKAFLGFSPEETLSVHADPIGHCTHELTSRSSGTRSGRHRGEMYPSEEEIKYNQRQIEGLRGGRRGYQDYKEEDNSEWEYPASHRKVETEWTRRDYKLPASHGDPPSSTNATNGEGELPELQDSSPISRSSLNRTVQSKNQEAKSAFANEDLEELGGSDVDMTSLLRGYKTARPSKDIGQGRNINSKVRSRWEDLESGDGRNRQKINEVQKEQPSNPFSPSALDDSSDEELEVYDEGNSNADASIQGYFHDYEIHRTKKAIPRYSAGIIVDGIYRPAQSPGFGLAVLGSSERPPPVKTSAANKKATEETSAKSKKKEQKKPAKAYFVKDSKKAPSKMEEDRLSKVMSKHPIGYTNRPIPFFESVNLPKILKKSAVAKVAVGERQGEKHRPQIFGNEVSGHRDGNRYMRETEVVGLSAENPGRKIEKHFAGEREVTKVSNIDTHKAGDNAHGSKDNYGATNDSGKHHGLGNSLSAVVAHAASTSASAAPTPSTKASSIPKVDSSMTEKLATLEFIVAHANAETRPEDAAPWAKAIAAQRGYRESASPPADDVRGKDSGVGGDQKKMTGSPKTN
ncbi:hypothetical protein ONS95_014915 [Cadophora gregata]|uniref:uncharacterized protein n=1 Tax=Cadophora gregata TaxID=51156 RepID=UPI0026DAB237|nr:uncharacterized protein ONS95_014915 [Cadophora gregata]KAK0113220.1 hypothetical protein ONS95_014915 [Cadophora gregata]KAK0125262.1 hypothetical protein ONS96_009117 [Cadophora gregata f. sp. sojae]